MTMQMLRWMMLGGAAILATVPAEAQTYDPRFPVCLQKWNWGGTTYFDCRYNSWEACRATAAGISAMCVDNPYWSGPRPSSEGRRTR
jgi:hypothetical protein